MLAAQGEYLETEEQEEGFKLTVQVKSVMEAQEVSEAQEEWGVLAAQVLVVSVRR